MEVVRAVSRAPGLFLLDLWWQNKLPLKLLLYPESVYTNLLLPISLLVLVLPMQWLLFLYSQVLGAALLWCCHLLSRFSEKLPINDPFFQRKQQVSLVAQLVLLCMLWRLCRHFSLYFLTPVAHLMALTACHSLCATATGTLFAAQLIRGILNERLPLELPPLSALVRRAFARSHFALYWTVQFAVLSLQIVREAQNHQPPPWHLVLLSAFNHMCSSPVSLFATSVTVSTLSLFVLNCTRKLLRVEGGVAEGGGGVVEGVTLALLSFQTGLVIGGKANVPLLILILFVVLSSLMQSLLEVAEPVALGGGRLALALCALLLVVPLYLSSLLSAIFPLDLWMVVVVANCSLTSVQALDVLVAHVLVWREWDDGVYYARAVARVARFAVALFVVGMGATEAVKGRCTFANAVILISHCYFNVWLGVVRGWRSLRARRAASARILSLSTPAVDQLDDCCAICFESAASGDACVTPCRHIFHRTCLRRWLNVQHTCPLCHKTLT